MHHSLKSWKELTQQKQMVDFLKSVGSVEPWMSSLMANLKDCATSECMYSEATCATFQSVKAVCCWHMIVTQYPWNWQWTLPNSYSSVFKFSTVRDNLPSVQSFYPVCGKRRLLIFKLKSTELHSLAHRRPYRARGCSFVCWTNKQDLFWHTFHKQIIVDKGWHLCGALPPDSCICVSMIRHKCSFGLVNPHSAWLQHK